MKIGKCMPREPMTFVRWTRDVGQGEIVTWLNSLPEVEFAKPGTSYNGHKYVRFRTTLDVTDAVYAGEVIVLDMNGYPERQLRDGFALDFEEVTDE